jgi:DNA excision repair protein ERCC-4
LVDDDNFAKKVIVDTRDLRSSLPFLLHLYGFDIEPRTITIGDYILTPSICVERKSLPDLIASLNSGRLHNQITAMTRAYATIILLIEFDPDKPFYLLQSRSASALKRIDLSPTDLISKLSLLIIHHPKLKLLWTSSPRLTCDIFYDLKRNEPEPTSTEDLEDSDSSPFNPKLKVSLKIHN